MCYVSDFEWPVGSEFRNHFAVKQRIDAALHLNDSRGELRRLAVIYLKRCQNSGKNCRMIALSGSNLFGQILKRFLAHFSIIIRIGGLHCWHLMLDEMSIATDYIYWIGEEFVARFCPASIKLYNSGEMMYSMLFVESIGNELAAFDDASGVEDDAYGGSEPAVFNGGCGCDCKYEKEILLQKLI